ncbi:hypothetical protein [Pseudomonas protegens]|uniref:hypothetical protein n=1 Tax=Pseudomonas protegens TaxID=380021 RepID=UPI00383BB250
MAGNVLLKIEVLGLEHIGGGMELNNREVAILIWAAIALVAMCVRADIRNSVFDVVKAFFNRHFIVFFLLAFAWMAVCVYGLFRVDLWEYANLKTTIVWGVTFAFSSIFSLEKIRSEKNFFEGLVSGSIKLTAIVIFITNLYSFSLWVEMILIPLVVFFSLLGAVSAREEKNALLTKMLEYLVALVGVLYFLNAMYEVFSDFKGFASTTNFKDFIGPIVLTFMFFPFLYVFGLYGSYNRAFAQVGLRFGDKKIASYSKWTAFRFFRTDVELMQQWVQEVYVWSASNPAEIKASIISMKYRRAREKNPLPVPSCDGWSPRDAQRFLYGFGLEIDSYKPAYGYEIWSGSSRYVKVNPDYHSTNVVYYIRGEDGVTRQLKVVLNVNSEEESVVAEDYFKEVAESLLRVIFGCVPEVLIFPLSNALDDDFVVGGRGVRFSKELYVHGASGGYSRSISIYNDETYFDEWG